MKHTETLILRFRDLVTAQGETIDRHRRIIAAHGAVWWGWWRKPNETIPDALFRRVADRAVHGLTLYLFDSGRHIGYRCRCLGIEWDKRHEDIPSPEVAHTPDYYRARTYAAWFRLGAIEEVAERDLQALTYLREDGLFRDGTSRFDAFYGKRIHGYRELAQQERTLWVVRSFAATDPSHEIQLLDSKRFHPSDFPREHLLSDSPRLIWTSDLHFGAHHGFREQSVARNPLGKVLLDALARHQLHPIAGHILSGDLTWRADPEEFHAAAAFIRDVQTQDDPYTVVPCPGNHDVAFSPAGDTTVEVPMAEASSRAAYATFYEGLFYKKPNAYLSCGRKFLLGGVTAVEVVALNSALLRQTEGSFQGHGFVGQDQLDHAAAEMGWQNNQVHRPYRILVMHHHLMPVTFREDPRKGAMYSVTLDAEAVVQWVVRYGIDLVLHGHMHRSFQARVSRPLDEALSGWHTYHVLGLASTGVEPAHADGQNSFACLTFSPGDIKVDWYGLDDQEPARVLQSLTIPREVRA